MTPRPAHGSRDELEDELFAPECDGTAPGRRWWVWLIYLALYAASIPWYLSSSARPPIWFGLPHWVVISLAATVGVAVFTAVIVFRYWPETEPAETRQVGDSPR